MAAVMACDFPGNDQASFFMAAKRCANVSIFH